MPLSVDERELKKYQANLAKTGAPVSPADVPQDKGTPTKKPRKSTAGIREPETKGWDASKAVIEGLAYPGATYVHRWQVLSQHAWIARCGRERARTGWLPVQGKGEPCQYCFADKEVQDG